MKNKLIVGFNESKAMRKSVLLVAVLGAFSLPSLSSASVSTYTDQSTFNSQGVIAFNSNFNDFPGTSFIYPGNPFTRGGVTYTSADNITWGSSTVYTTTTERLIGGDSAIPTTLITGTIATGYNMFGFNIGAFGSTPVSITINTNVSSYLYPSLAIANSQAGLLDYKGFIATTPGEFFTGFKIAADNANPNFAGITNVAVGNVSAVPVPGAVWLFASGLLGLGALRKKTQA